MLAPLTQARCAGFPRLFVMLALAGIVGLSLWRPAPVSASGSSRAFWVAYEHGWTRISARLAARSGAVDVYQAPGVSVTGAMATDMAKTISQRILPTDLKLFGTPRSLGRVTVLMLPLSDPTLGYFDENDLVWPHQRGLPFHSNDQNLVYIRPPAMMPDSSKMADFYEVVAHEVQHLIDFRLRVLDRHLAPESTWLNEGLSFYAQVANGYWTERDRLKLDAAAADPSWRLSSLDQHDRSFSAHARTAYGRAGLFVTYLAVRFGQQFVRDLITRRSTGLAAVQELLARSHLDTRRVFSDWGVSLYFPGGLAAPISRLLHGFRVSPHLLIPPVIDYPFRSAPSGRSQVDLPPWSNAYLQFLAPTADTLHVDAVGAPGTLSAAVVLFDSTRANPPRISWLHPVPGGLAADIPQFGKQYDRATLVINSLPPDSSDCDSAKAQPVIVKADIASGRSVFSAAGKKSSRGGSWHLPLGPAGEHSASSRMPPCFS